jgi:hypothetical protein
MLTAGPILLDRATLAPDAVDDVARLSVDARALHER